MKLLANKFTYKEWQYYIPADKVHEQEPVRTIT